MYQIIIRRIAAADIDDIAAYIRQDNPSRAQSFTEEISEKIAIIAERPLSFPARDDLVQDLRAAHIGSYLIFFFVSGSSIDIVRVVHGARELSNLF
ncbi:MAG: type II toxin-antitoxin system RelE/ParE family toxin [Sphingorhabdus sp.]